MKLKIENLKGRVKLRIMKIKIEKGRAKMKREAEGVERVKNEDLKDEMKM